MVPIMEDPGGGKGAGGGGMLGSSGPEAVQTMIVQAEADSIVSYSYCDKPWLFKKMVFTTIQFLCMLSRYCIWLCKGS